jgi:hypothetical protein
MAAASLPLVIEGCLHLAPDLVSLFFNIAGQT